MNLITSTTEKNRDELPRSGALCDLRRMKDDLELLSEDTLVRHNGRLHLIAYPRIGSRRGRRHGESVYVRAAPSQDQPHGGVSRLGA